MIQLLADENFDGNIIRGLLRRLPHVVIRRVQDVGLSGQSDPRVLEWAAERGLIVVSHDIKTLPAYAAKRIGKGQKMPGLFCVSADAPIGQVIADLQLLLECSEEGEWEGRILFLPL